MGLTGAKLVSTPMELNLKLTSTEFDNSIPSKHDTLIEDYVGYQRLVGKLLYLTTTRPDISFDVQSISQLMHSPKKSHLDVALRLVRYLKTSTCLGILMSLARGHDLNVFGDSDWGSCINSRIYVSGYLFQHGGSPISWKSKK